MTLVRGPSDPEQFRTKVYGARWYRDPLPADSRWSVMAEPVPAVTTIKRSWGKPFRKKTPGGLVVPLDAYWAAQYVCDHYAELSAMTPDQALTMIATAPDRSLSRAADRGTAVHTVMESLAVGLKPAVDLLDPEVRPFVPAALSFIDEWQPTFLMTEVVAINREVGFGGTFDAIVDLPIYGRTIVDWKSRGGDHGAYGDEACQLGGYASADYFVVTEPTTGELERIDPPVIEAAAVISFTADDGYRLYPVDVDKARRSFLAMYETWRVRREGEKEARASIGAPAIPPKDPEANRQGPGYGYADGRYLRPVPPLIAGPSGHAHAVGADSDGVSAPPPVRHVSLLDDEDQQPEADQDGSNNGQQGGSDLGESRVHGSNGQVPDERDPQGDRGQVAPFPDHLRDRVVAIAQTLGDRGVPVPWPDVPKLSTGLDYDAAQLLAIDEWCWEVEAILGLPFPPAGPPNEGAAGAVVMGADEAAATASSVEAEQVPAVGTLVDDAVDWGDRGRALLALLDDDRLARACASAGRCDGVRMSKLRFLALASVVTQVSEPTGVLVPHWSAHGVEVRAVPDIEKALIAAMPGTEGNRRFKTEALKRARRVADRLGEPPPRVYADLCADLLLSACVAVGHGVTASDGNTTEGGS